MLDRFPEFYLITPDFDGDAGAYLDSLERSIASGAGMVRFRPGQTVAPEVCSRLLAGTQEICAAAGVPLLLGQKLWSLDQAQCGLHLEARSIKTFDRRVQPASFVMASCHNYAELVEAARAGVDAVTLSPVLPTESHPGRVALGWERFRMLVTSVNLPAYALGGLGRPDLARAQSTGAVGIAGISGLWFRVRNKGD